VKKKRFSTEQIAAVLHQAEQGDPRGRGVSPGRHLRAELLPVEEGLWRPAAQRSAGAEAAARRGHQVEALGGGPVPRQGHVAGYRSKKF
jgi:hypothetical protein